MHRIALISLALLAPVLIAVPAAAAGETCDGRAATIVVPLDVAEPAYTKPVTGTPGDDVIVGTALGDTINGAGGNDVICGMAGADELAGGEGDDRLFGGLDGREPTSNPLDSDWLGDLLSPGPGDDYVDLGVDPESQRSYRNDQVRYDDSATGVHVDLTPIGGLGRATGEGTDTIVVVGRMTVVGSPFDDHVTGSPYGDTLMTDRGSDVVFGGEGNDAILPDIAGWDVMETADPEGMDFVSPDTAHGGGGDDSIYSVWGPTTAEGGDGDDYISTTDPEWGRNGTADGSHIEGGAGDDRIFAELVRKLDVSGDAGDDKISLSVYGGSGRTASNGGAGNDRLALSTGRGLAPGTRITVDRRRARIAADRTLASMGGFEHHELSGSAVNWVYLGTNAKDDVSTGRGRTLLAHTFGGRDRVEGTKGRDVLDLGRGADRADGSLGRDTCMGAERAKSCEIRR